MFNRFKKYTDEENLLRDSLSFDVSDKFLKDALTIERENVGKMNEKTLIVFPFDEIGMKDYPQFTFKISREQHDELVERFRTIHGL